MVLPLNVPRNPDIYAGDESSAVHRLCVKCMYDVGMKRSNFFLPEPAVAALKALSEKTGLSVSEHIRRAIDEYLKRHQ